MQRKYAMIFAAGLGSRLGDFSKNSPKALLNVGGNTLLFHCLSNLKKFHYTDVVVNVHHFANKVVEFLENNKFEGLNIYISDESDQLLDTGGGLLKAKIFFDEATDILLHNVDIISNLDLKSFEEMHKNSDNLATLAVKKRETSRFLLFNSELNLKGWKNINTNEEIIFSNEKLEPYAFSGIHLVSGRIFQKMSKLQKFSMTNFYLELCKDNNIGAFIHNEDQWVDVGKIDQISKAEEILKQIST